MAHHIRLQAHPPPSPAPRLRKTTFTMICQQHQQLKKEQTRSGLVKVPVREPLIIRIDTRNTHQTLKTTQQHTGPDQQRDGEGPCRRRARAVDHSHRHKKHTPDTQDHTTPHRNTQSTQEQTSSGMVKVPVDGVREPLIIRTDTRNTPDTQDHTTQEQTSSGMVKVPVDRVREPLIIRTDTKNRHKKHKPEAHKNTQEQTRSGMVKVPVDGVREPLIVRTDTKNTHQTLKTTQKHTGTDQQRDGEGPC
jgi:sortase (surface protein transpeptidase)